MFISRIRNPTYEVTPDDGSTCSVETYIYIIFVDLINKVKPGYNDIGLYDNSSIV
jgi:hypothetical protein